MARVGELTAAGKERARFGAGFPVMSICGDGCRQIVSSIGLPISGRGRDPSSKQLLGHCGIILRGSATCGHAVVGLKHLSEEKAIGRPVLAFLTTSEAELRCSSYIQYGKEYPPLEIFPELVSQMRLLEGIRMPITGYTCGWSGKRRKSQFYGVRH